MKDMFGKGNRLWIIFVLIGILVFVILGKYAGSDGGAGFVSLILIFVILFVGVILRLLTSFGVVDDLSRSLGDFGLRILVVFFTLFVLLIVGWILLTLFY